MQWVDDIANDLSAALFWLPTARLPEALARLPMGSLWQSCLPGMEPALALRVLGPTAAQALEEAARGWTGIDGGLLASTAGLPFSVATDGDLTSLGQALLQDGLALVAQAEGGAAQVPNDLSPLPWSVEVIHQPRSVWLSRVWHCLDSAAADVFAGTMPDTVWALLRGPEADLSGFVSMADAEVRIRFLEGVAVAAGAPVPLDCFRRTHWRRGAAAGLLSAVHATLNQLPGGTKGYDAEGWPSWWQASGADPTVALDCVPSAVLSDALDVRTSCLPGIAR